MTSEEIRAKFLDFFKKKDHAIVPSSSLISDDPSVLFTTAGMQQFKPYYTGELNPETAIHPNLGKPVGKNTVSVQKCFRTSDIDSVGDESHLTFFEMLGNFSFGGYFKEKAIEYAYEFITKELELKIDFVSIFGGDSENNIPADEESEKIWHKVAPGLEIKKAGKKDNFWGPTGNEGPCGPTTEIYINGVEIWNIVFNEYFQDKNKKFAKLKTPGVDTGMGLERLVMVVQNKPTVFETDLFAPILNLFGKTTPVNSKRIVTDHTRGVVFLIADGILPSNKEQGYILRRLMRRIMSHLSERQYFEIHKQGEPIHQSATIESVAKLIIEQYGSLEQYRYLLNKKDYIIYTIQEEHKRFMEINKNGRKIFEKICLEAFSSGTHKIKGKDIFDLVTTHGFALEWIKDLAKERNIELDLSAFDEEFKKHQEISRAGLEKKFGGHGLKEGGEITGASEEEKQKIVRLHTATHLLHQALFDLFGDKIKQMGSDINSERFRFDFPLERKLTDEELKKLEAVVNQKIKEALPVRFEEKTKEEAMAEGAKSFFKVKYPEKVKVYYINDYSKEICNGPHVENTSEIGRFKILKEESVAAGVRRIKATVE